MKPFCIAVFIFPSGGNIKIEQTEAQVAIDVNTGSFTGKTNYDETVRKTNLEAAAEIARQIRLRTLSGVIIIDFIDMVEEKYKNEVLEMLKKVYAESSSKIRSILYRAWTCGSYP